MPGQRGGAALAPVLAPMLAPMLALGFAGLLGGCAALNPANWFHQHEGGVIAQQKGPLPGASQPYPNLATVPPPPAAPDLAALQHISNGLIADRAHAHLLAEASPLPDPSRPSTAPALFGVGSLPPPAPPPPGGGTVASASMPAVTAPPAAAAAPPPPAPARPEAPPARAPVGPVQSAALPPPAASGPPPTVPAAPPARPNLTGAGIAAPSPPPAAPAAAPPPPAPPPVPGPAADQVPVPFAPGSAAVPPVAVPGLHALAARRGSRLVEALGRGDATGADPAAQLAAVQLGLARAQAIAAALRAAGVPASAIQIRSDASGTGGLARLE